MPKRNGGQEALPDQEPTGPCAHRWKSHRIYSKLRDVQVCPTLCDPRDYTVHGILQTRTLEWVAFSSCRGSSQPRDGTQASHIAGGFGGFFTSWATREKGLRCGMVSFYRLMNGWIILFQARGGDFQGLDHRAPFGLLGWLQTGGCVIPYANTLQ